MIKKTKHPSNKAERRAIAAKKLHSNASPVFKLLKEKEELDAATASKRTRGASPRGNSKGLDLGTSSSDVLSSVL